MPFNIRLIATLFLLLASLPAPAGMKKASFVEIEGVAYGAQADERGPIGGGAGYTDIVPSGDHTVSDLDSLLEALSRARAGEVVFIPGETEIDLTARIYIEDLVLEVPAGVTLAGDRGQEGSQGALLTSDALDTPEMIRTLGPGVRITGLRIRGPNTKRYLDHHYRSFTRNEADGGFLYHEGEGPRGGHSYYYQFPVQRGISTSYDALRVDNCDLSGFAHSAVSLRKGKNHHIHHNFIHHCQYQGLGYGISLTEAVALIERNRFDWNRHSIAGSGLAGSGYVARHNLELGTSLSHCFDMHGGRDRKDGTNIAGTAIEIANNTFRAPQTPIVIRGIPEKSCRVHHNWFPRHRKASEAVRAEKGTTVENNAYGDPPVVLPIVREGVEDG
ncbi:MAG: right-handed parallel beta-helix repeat-containing protein [Oceanipulchritudo sp.]